MNRIFKSATIDKTTDDGIFTAYASTWDKVDYDNDRILKGAFSKSLAESIPVMLFDHDQSKPIGKWLELIEDDMGLKVKGQLLINDSPKALEVYNLIKSGAINGLSIGFTINDFSYDSTGVREIKELTLFEISIVSIPCNSECRVISIKSLSSIKEIEKLLKEKGFTVSESKNFISKFKSIYKEQIAEDIKKSLEVKSRIDNLILRTKNTSRLLKKS